MSARYPPGPANFNFWCGGTWRHAWHLWSDPLAFSTHMARRYGDVVFYRLFYYPAWQINHPDLVREVLVTKAKSFVKERRVMGVIRDTQLVRDDWYGMNFRAPTTVIEGFNFTGVT